MRLIDRLLSSLFPLSELACLTSLCLFMQGCQTSSGRSHLNQMWSLETSAALTEACRRDIDPVSPEEVSKSIEQLGACVHDEELVREWHDLTVARITGNWPRDFLESDSTNKTCLQSLTDALALRYEESLLRNCSSGQSGALRNALIESVGQMNEAKFSDFTGMTRDGCFIQRDWQATTNNPAQTVQIKKECRPLIQKIHKVKDPGNKNLAWIDPFVIELTGNRSSASITYGLPNCHGTAQAAAGDLLGGLYLEGVQFARLYEKDPCNDVVEKWFAENKSKPLRDLNLIPGGLIINMDHADCKNTNCGKVKLWIDHCPPVEKQINGAPFDGGIFIDGMCVECWASLLEKQGFKRTSGSTVPDCILTTADHSVYVVHESAGWCYSYEATSPYGPPQLRAGPCVVMTHQFKNRFCR